MMGSWHGFIFKRFDKFWKNLRYFTFHNKSIFEIFFILLYSLEQIFLITLTYKSNDIKELGFIISIFAVIVLSTFAFHKLLMESRIKYLEKEVAEADSDKRMLEEENRTLKDSCDSLLQEMQLVISKYLNTNETNDKNKKGAQYEKKRS